MPQQTNLVDILVLEWTLGTFRGSSVDLTKNTYGPCASFSLRQMHEEKKITWDS